MTVADLISILRDMPQHARVVLPEPSASLPRQVYSLGVGEVQHLELGATEAHGLVMVEPWDTRRPGAAGPFDGVLLGELFFGGDVWLAQNRAALDSSNAYVEQHGLPLAKVRDATVEKPHCMQIDLDTLPETLRTRPEMQAVLLLAARFGVRSVSVRQDIDRGFDAELLFDDAPTWSLSAGEFNYLAGHVLDALVRYAYEHKFKEGRA